MLRRSQYALLIAVAALTAAAQSAVPIPARAKLAEAYVAKPEVARAAAFGFDDVVADYHWLQAVQIAGSATRPEQHGRALGRLIDVTTALDPWVGHPYRFAAVWLTETREDVEEADRILARGISYAPKEWRNRFYLAFNLFFQLGQEAEAADVLEPAIPLDGAPRYLGRLVARLRAGTGGLDASATFLEELARTAQDPRTRAEYEKALDEIDTERRARFLDDAREVSKRKNGVYIASVGDLVKGQRAVLSGLPPEPNGWEWKLDDTTGKIVSSFYGVRYRPHVHPAHRIHQDQIRDTRVGADGTSVDAAGASEEETR